MKKREGILLVCAYALMLDLGADAQTRVFSSANNQSEPYIAVNPTNPNNIIIVAITNAGGYNRIGAYYTMNGGQSWNGSDDIIINLPNKNAGDPVIGFDGSGVAFCLFQVFDDKVLYMQKSTDGGATWINRVTVYQSANNVDRPWMAISENPNASGIYEIYLTVTEVPPDNQVRIKLLKSDDAGFEPIYSFGTGTQRLQGSSVALGPDGEVYVAYAENDPGTFATIKIFVQRSANGGSSFTQELDVSVDQIGTKISTEYYVKNGQIRADSYPRLAVDRSPYPSNRGTVYLVWADKALPNPDANILMYKRSPAGTWALSSLANSPAEEWAPAVWVGPEGVRYFLYYKTASGSDEIQIQLLAHKADGTLIWSKLVGVIPAFQINTSYKPFLGDYFGVTGWLEKVFGAWIEARGQMGGHSNSQVYFKQESYPSQSVPSGYVRATVTQVDESDVAFGKVGRWRINKFINYAVPYDFLWDAPSNPPLHTEILRSDQNFKHGTTQKYNNWLNVNDVLNHRSFDILTSTTLIKGRFKTAHNATLRTEVIDGGSLNIEFRDPWLIDDADSYGSKNRGQSNAVWYSKPSPFSPNISDPNYKGVFLNEQPDPLNPQKPYYSVRPTNQAVNGLPWFLWNWVTTNATVTQPTSSETPVVFTANNADVKARVKLRLGSSLSNATATNGQRKLVYTSYAPAKFHLVYESAAEIYYTFSTDNGATWSNEIMLSSSDGNNKYPSIAAYQNKIYVIWQRTTSTNNYTVYVRRYNGSSWIARQTLGTASLTTGNNPLPVITLKEVYVGGQTKIRGLAVWKGASALRFRTSDDDGATWTTEAAVPNTSSTTKNPSLSAGLFFDLAYQNAYLTYDDGSLIRLAAYSTSWASTETPPGSITSNANASHVIAGETEGLNGHAHVVWQGTDPNSGTAAVFYQRKSGYDGTWSAVQSYVSSGYQRPVITHMSSNNLAMLWDKSGSVYKATYTYSTNSWSAAQNMGTGQYPTLSAAFGSSHPAGKYGFMTNSTAPYKIQIAAETLQKSSEENGKYYRRVAVADTTGSGFLLDIGDVYIKTKSDEIFPISFVAVDDTLLTLPPEDYWNYLETEAVVLTSEADSLIAEVRLLSQNAGRLFAADKDEIQIDFEIIDADNDQKLANLGEAVLMPADGKLETRRGNKTAPLVGRKVLLRPVVQNITREKSDLLYSLIHVHDYRNFDKRARPEESRASHGDVTMAYRLGPVYPNPFNPTATIAYSLPHEDTVLLKVFDILGNEVATLVNEQQIAGEYRVQLHGKDWVSGIYFCRLQAGNFSQTIKVTLVK